MTDPTPDPTILDTIVEAIEGRLQALPQITDPDAVEVEPGGDPAIFPALQIFVFGGSALEPETAMSRWSMRLTVWGYAQRGDGKLASRERSTLWAATIAALVDEQFGGIVERIDPADWQFQTAELSSKRRLAFIQAFDVEFSTLRSNPAVQA
jgi:hypothetical protein